MTRIAEVSSGRRVMTRIAEVSSTRRVIWDWDSLHPTCAGDYVWFWVKKCFFWGRFYQVRGGAVQWKFFNYVKLWVRGVESWSLLTKLKCQAEYRKLKISENVRFSENFDFLKDLSGFCYTSLRAGIRLAIYRALYIFACKILDSRQHSSDASYPNPM